MGNVIYMDDWAKKHHRDFGPNNRFVSPKYDTTVMARYPNQKLTQKHIQKGYVSRRQYFWEMSNIYGITVDEIHIKATLLGSDEDFGQLVEWLKRNDASRNR